MNCLLLLNVFFLTRTVTRPDLPDNNIEDSQLLKLSAEITWNRQIDLSSYLGYSAFIKVIYYVQALVTS